MKQYSLHKTALEANASYQIQNRRFLVESVFQKEGESLGSVLLRLMKLESEKD